LLAIAFNLLLVVSTGVHVCLADAEARALRDGVTRFSKADDQGSALAATQIALMLCGYDPGPADGVWGVRTKAAVSAFLADRSSAEAALEELALRMSLVTLLREPTMPTVGPVEASPEATEAAESRSPLKETIAPTYKPHVAENGDIQGADNDGDGRLEPVYVRGYYRKDGTYVRGHYRARPRRR
jgi:peptidoglycan hydrolase-like protein with peptidoglycan-binding domain